MFLTHNRILAIVIAAAIAMAIATSQRAAAQCQVARFVSDDPSAWFGYSVSISGDSVVVGAPVAGNIFVYERSDLTWSLSATLTPGFMAGWSVSIWNDRFAAGNPIAPYAGSVLVYERTPPGAWHLDATLRLPPTSNDFGQAVSLDGNRLAVGAPGEMGGPSAVYVFEFDGAGGWAQVAALGAPGYTAALSGDVVVTGGWDPYVVHVFERDSGGLWLETAELAPSDIGNAAVAPIAISAARIVVGAPSADGAETQSGAVYLYERQSDGTWPQMARLFPDDGQTGAAFGRSVSIDGTELLVGARESAYLFRCIDGDWIQSAKLQNSHSQFGQDVSLGGHAAVVTARDAVYIFAIGPDADGDGTPDPCQCMADFNDDGTITLADLGVVLASFGLQNGADRVLGDTDGDADIDLSDLAFLLGHFGMTCP